MQDRPSDQCRAGYASTSARAWRCSRAIEIVVALARIYGASRLVPVASVQVAGVSYKNLGEAGLEFLREWAAQGARVRVPTTLNPAGIDLRAWEALGFIAEFAEQQRAVIQAYTAMGIAPTCTCTPYLVGNRPAFGQHIAWAESSAVSFANSVLGAGPTARAAPPRWQPRSVAAPPPTDSTSTEPGAQMLVSPLPSRLSLGLERAGLPRRAPRCATACPTFGSRGARPISSTRPCRRSDPRWTASRAWARPWPPAALWPCITSPA